LDDISNDNAKFKDTGVKYMIVSGNGAFLLNIIDYLQ